MELNEREAKKGETLNFKATYSKGTGVFSFSLIDCKKAYVEATPSEAYLLLQYLAKSFNCELKERKK